MNAEKAEIKFEIREIKSFQEIEECLKLQREAFALPDIEISPLRHFIVTKHAGGWTLGAFVEQKLVGFVLTVPAFRHQSEPCFYSHMAAVSKDFQNYGIGAKLKWAQREKALQEGKRFIKRTFHPMQMRNAHFNLNRLGAIVRNYAVNFYGTDYMSAPNETSAGIDSDRLFAEWELDAERVKRFERGENPPTMSEIVKETIVPPNWEILTRENPIKAREELLRVREEFQTAFAEQLICARFERDNEKPRYFFYKNL